MLLCELVIFWIYLDSDIVLRENVLKLFVKKRLELCELVFVILVWVF